MSERKWVCIHGHFYQPPRENPWLEAIEPQPSAHPYRDWNERITAECYRPNTAARVVDGTSQIIQIVDNYQRMSFNVGPTLMSWLEDHAPDVHAALIEADRASRARFDGHGSAMAQAYNHMIMPLASPRDRVTQVRWGIADFQRRFGRDARGHVAARVRRRYRDARGARRRGHQVHRARAAPGEGVAAAGRRVADDRRSIRGARTCASCRRGGRSICSSTTARPRRRSRSSGCSPTATRSSRG